jgi:hypothetical protein
MSLQTFSRAVALLGSLLGWISPAMAKEPDQFSDRLSVLDYYDRSYRTLPDAPGPQAVDRVLDARMDRLLDQLAAQLQESPPRSLAERDELVRAVFQHPLLAELITPYEEWVKHEAPVPLYKVRDKGIYGHAVDYDDVRMTWYIELSPTIQIAGATIGIDKLGHFLAQGFSYLQLMRASPPSLTQQQRMAAVRQLGHRQEYGSLGVATTGIYSFADQAANWAGMWFYVALFESVEDAGKRHAPYFARGDDGRYRRTREFHWAEWLTADWDEVLNPSAAQSATFFRKIADNFRRKTATRNGPPASICDHFRTDPKRFLAGEPALRPRESYALPAAAAKLVPHAVDVRSICP